MGASVRVPTALVNTMTKKHLRRTRFISLLLPRHSPSSKEVRAGTEAGAVEDPVC